MNSAIRSILLSFCFALMNVQLLPCQNAYAVPIRPGRTRMLPIHRVAVLALAGIRCRSSPRSTPYADRWRGWHLQYARHQLHRAPGLLLRSKLGWNILQSNLSDRRGPLVSQLHLCCDHDHPPLARCRLRGARVFRLRDPDGFKPITANGWRRDRSEGPSARRRPIAVGSTGRRAVAPGSAPTSRPRGRRRTSG